MHIPLQIAKEKWVIDLSLKCLENEKKKKKIPPFMTSSVYRYSVYKV